MCHSRGPILHERAKDSPPESEAIRGVLFYPAAANSCLYVRASVSLTAAVSETTDICVRACVCLFDSGGGLSRGVGGRLHSYDKNSKSATYYAPRVKTIIIFFLFHRAFQFMGLQILARCATEAKTCPHNFVQDIHKIWNLGRYRRH